MHVSIGYESWTLQVQCSAYIDRSSGISAKRTCGWPIKKNGKIKKYFIYECEKEAEAAVANGSSTKKGATHTQHTAHRPHAFDISNACRVHSTITPHFYIILENKIEYGERQANITAAAVATAVFE